jgi:hypothetical protein
VGETIVIGDGSIRITVCQLDAAAHADSLELAIEVLTFEHNLGAHGLGGFEPRALRNTIESLQMIRLGMLLASRNANREPTFTCACGEQRRPGDGHTCEAAKARVLADLRNDGRIVGDIPNCCGE